MMSFPLYWDVHLCSRFESFYLVEKLLKFGSCKSYNGMLWFEKDTAAVSQSKSLHISKAYTTEFRTGNEDDEPAGFTRSKTIYIMGMILGLTPNKKTG